MQLRNREEIMDSHSFNPELKIDHQRIQCLLSSNATQPLGNGNAGMFFLYKIKNERIQLPNGYVKVILTCRFSQTALFSCSSRPNLSLWNPCQFTVANLPSKTGIEGITEAWREKKRMAQDAPQPIVHLNVGGTIFSTSVETLAQVLTHFPSLCQKF